MDRRRNLHLKLEQIAGAGVPVLYQPPSMHKLSYPCILYQYDGTGVKHADNKKYHRASRYQVTLIARHPDPAIVDEISNMEYCTFQQWFAKDGLNHYVFSIYN